MNFKILLLISLLASVCITEEVKEEDNVAILTNDNFNGFMESHEYVLVKFYAPWCGHCKQMAPEYAKAAGILKEDKIFLAKVDATVEEKLQKDHDVQGFPTIKFFKKVDGKMQPMDFNGGRTADDIVNWCRKRIGDATSIIETAEALEELKKEKDVVVVYYGKSAEDKEFAVFKEAALVDDSVTFVHLFSESIEKDISRPQVRLYKQFDEKQNNFEGEITFANLQKFVSKWSFPQVMIFDDRAITKIFQEENTAIFLFCDPDNEKCAAAETSFADASSKLKGTEKKPLFCTSHPKDASGHYERLAEFVGADITNLPSIVLMNPQEEVSKFKFDKELTSANLVSFIDDYNNGKLEKFFKSQNPQEDEANVKVIVGKNWQEKVLDNDKDVLVEFYAPWCGHCKQLAPIYSAMADKLAVNPNIIIAKCDSTANEIEGVTIESFPTLKFYPANNKNEPIDYSGEKDEESILKFLKEKATKDWVEIQVEVKKEEEDKPKEEKTQDL